MAMVGGAVGQQVSFLQNSRDMEPKETLEKEGLSRRRWVPRAGRRVWGRDKKSSNPSVSACQGVPPGILAGSALSAQHLVGRTSLGRQSWVTLSTVLSLSEPNMPQSRPKSWVCRLCDQHSLSLPQRCPDWVSVALLLFRASRCQWEGAWALGQQHLLLAP